MTIAILGCGPAGLMAAHACSLANEPYAIFSAGEKSRLGGAQFLNMALPGITELEPDTEITYIINGSAEDYRWKVYGDYDPSLVHFENTNWPKTGDTQVAWNLAAAYERLWSLYGPFVNRESIGVTWLADNQFEFKRVYSTIPLEKMCLKPTEHRFITRLVTISVEQYTAVPNHTIIYDGTMDRTWYRASQLFGHYGTEWNTATALHHSVLNSLPLIHDRKPLATTCDCWPAVTRLGRKGTWTKGVLTHHAYLQVQKELGILDATRSR